jgi:gas vesicle protein
MAQGNNLMSKLIMGMAIGAAIGILLAPKRGREMREDIMEQGDRVKSRAPELAENVREQGEKVRSGLSGVTGMVASTRERMGSMAREMRERASSSGDDMNDRISRALERHTTTMHQRVRTQKSQEMRGKRGPSNKGLIIGGLIGATAGILMAPRPGSETRRNLMEQTRDLKARTDRLANEVKEKAGPQIERAREQASSMAEDAKQRMRSSNS